MDLKNNTGRNRILNSVVYIILALCVVTIMCIAIFTVANRNTGKENQSPESGQVPIVPEVTTNRQKAITEPNESVAIPPAIESGQVYNPLPEPENNENENEEAEPIFEQGVPVENLEEVLKTEPTSSKPQEFVMPVQGYITKGHHDDMLVYSLTMNDYRVHLGIDIGSTVGAPVYACTSGTITEIYDEPFMGKTMVIEHGGGLKSHYMNLSESLPQGIDIGAKVETGQVIAGVGETSLVEMADTMHLHFEMTKDGLQVDPLEYIDYIAATFDYEE